MRFARDNVLNEMTWASSHFDLGTVFLGSNGMSNYPTTSTNTVESTAASMYFS